MGPSPAEPAPAVKAGAKSPGTTGTGTTGAGPKSIGESTGAAKPTTGGKTTGDTVTGDTATGKAPTKKAPAKKAAGGKDTGTKSTAEKAAAGRPADGGAGPAGGGSVKTTDLAAKRQLVKDVRARAKALREEARKDPSAVDRLRELYEGQPDHVLGALSDDPVAAQVRDRRRAQQQKDELARIDASDSRPPHEATVRVLDPNGRVVHNESLRSGGVTPEQRAARGLNRANQDSHTEAKAVARAPLTAGRRMYITGQYDPCGSCRAAMQAAALRSGGRINYWWPGGPPEGMWFPLGSGGAR
ncbi:hypothetical protein [Embleya scabrispora]|uniref:hypothetical protein n=1 Tax=Embleya scabrispora TaxID=159449 RepID=UPI001374F00A|nr:hypothetical protein [Embleya scabrispora]